MKTAKMVFGDDDDDDDDDDEKEEVGCRPHFKQSTPIFTQ